MKTFTRSGLKSVKCFGSSTTFANQMKRVPGVTGVTTFVKTNTVKVLYDPLVTDTTNILKSIFSPVKIQIRKPGEEVNSLDLFRLRVDNFLDQLDAVYLKELLLKEKSVWGFTTEFDCPVRINVYSDSTSAFEPGKLKDLIETGEIDQTLANGKIMRIKLKFRVTQIEKDTLQIPTSEYLRSMYYEYVKMYKGTDSISFNSYNVLFPGGGTEATNLMLDKLSYHLSRQPGIIGIKSALTNRKPMLTIYFDKSLTTDKNVHEILNSSRILSPDAKGENILIANPLSFPFKGESVIK